MPTLELASCDYEQSVLVGCWQVLHQYTYQG